MNIKIGTRVLAPNVEHYSNDVGSPCSFPLPRTVEGIVVERALFLDLRVRVEFLINFQKNYVWKPATEVNTLMEATHLDLP